jgi:hypothetical protein
VVLLAEMSTRVAGPVLPQFPIPPTSRPADVAPPGASEIVTLIPSTNPVALVQEKLPAKPVNIEVDGVPMLLFRDPSTGLMRAYDRRFGALNSRFIANYSPTRARHGVAFLDVATNSGWNLQGVAVDGDPEIKGLKLRPIGGIEEDLYWNVMKHWYPNLQLLTPETPR